MNTYDNRISVVLAVEDASIRMSLGYLFSVVLEYDFKATSILEDAASLLRPSGSGRVLIISGDQDKSLELVRKVAKTDTPPVIVVLDHLSDGQFGAQSFRAGATDVVRPPFALKEMAYRIQLRVDEMPALEEFSQERVNWDAEAYVANEAQLTTAEAQVARILIRHDGEIVSRDDLSYQIDQRPWKYGDRKFDVHVAKIRKKFQAAFGAKIEVETVRSAGYKLTFLEDGLSSGVH
ncbi:winged helix-turn-helix domain-containing protein [Pelagimonas sp. KU-00592-HH]|uniref:winged helix-turn-helix domain-containing protein n=1 Tax=Pelagimonas sp. KU-00592-HH TaxID=3127651 RepID=UPI0033407E68